MNYIGLIVYYTQDTVLVTWNILLKETATIFDFTLLEGKSEKLWTNHMLLHFKK
jgi:hypothetical protein